MKLANDFKDPREACYAFKFRDTWGASVAQVAFAGHRWMLRFPPCRLDLFAAACRRMFRDPACPIPNEVVAELLAGVFKAHGTTTAVLIQPIKK